MLLCIMLTVITLTTVKIIYVTHNMLKLSFGRFPEHEQYGFGRIEL